MSCVKFEHLFLKNSSEFEDYWVQERIAEDPSSLAWVMSF